MNIIGNGSVILVAALTAFVLNACDSPDTDSLALQISEGDLGIHNQGIIGGEETNYESWQGVVMLNNGFSMCTGSLIHPRVVLSAGHCVKIKQSGFTFDGSKTPAMLQIKGGPTGQTFYSRAERIIPHPSWKGELDEEAGDLSLILLRKEVVDVETFHLRDFPMPKNGDEGWVVGYGGATSDLQTKGSGVHRAGETTLLNVLPKLIETGEWANTCQGDSGGPLFSKQDGEWVVTGVTSFGAGSCYEEGGSYSVNLLPYCGWLNDTMMELVGEDLGLENCNSCKAIEVDSWGQACGETYPCCPVGTACRYPDDFSNGSLGYCAPKCCALSQADEAYCTDITSGEERCSFSDINGSAFCAIHCEDDDDCIEGTVCKNKPFAEQKICIAVDDGPGGETDCDIDMDVDSDTDSDTDTDADTETDGGATDTDSDADTDTDDDTENDSDVGDGGVSEPDSDSSGCGCVTAGRVSGDSGKISMWSSLVSLI
jgi:Trypsin